MEQENNIINIIIYGVNGYIGRNLKKYLLKHKNINIISSQYKRIENKEEVMNDIKKLKPDRIISAIGFVKKDQCFSTSFLDDDMYLVDNLQNNLYIHNVIMNACLINGVHFTYMGTGCIYTSNNNKLFHESDEPNCFKSKYTTIKLFTDKLLSLYKDDILILRVRQCLNDDNSPQNFLKKFLKFENISDIENSFTVIPSIFPIISDLILKKKTGKFNCVNKGSISVKEINHIFNRTKFKVSNRNDMYEKYSNNILSTEKLEEYNVEDIKNAILKIKKQWNY